METRLGPAGAVLGRFYALFALLMAFAMGAMAQSGALADTFSAAFTLPRWRVGLVTAVLALAILLGGIRRIADISTVLVPVMALLYLGGGAAVILGNLPRLPEAVTLMLRCAVAPEAALGGAFGDRHPPGGPPLGRCPERFFQRGGVGLRRHHRRLR